MLTERVQQTGTLHIIHELPWDYNRRLTECTATPVHDWSSHGAGAFLGLAVRRRSVLAPFAVDQAADLCSCGHENVDSAAGLVSMSWTAMGTRTTATRNT